MLSGSEKMYGYFIEIKRQDISAMVPAKKYSVAINRLIKLN